MGFFPGEIPTDLEVDNTAQTTQRPGQLYSVMLLDASKNVFFFFYGS